MVLSLLKIQKITDKFCSNLCLPYYIVNDVVENFVWGELNKLDETIILNVIYECCKCRGIYRDIKEIFYKNGIDKQKMFKSIKKYKKIVYNNYIRNKKYLNKKIKNKKERIIDITKLKIFLQNNKDELKLNYKDEEKLIDTYKQVKITEKLTGKKPNTIIGACLMKIGYYPKLISKLTKMSVNTIKNAYKLIS